MADESVQPVPWVFSVSMRAARNQSAGASACATSTSSARAKL